MIDQDFAAFGDTVRRLATVMRLRANPTELTQITQAYFKAFRRRPLSSVIAGADSWIERGDKFPKPAQWLRLMPQREGGVARLMPLTRDEADQWLQAERQRFEGRPDGCVLCLAADVHEKPIRFVPDVDEDGRDARGLIGDREVTRGHWAHGEELARWYVARADFYARYLELFPEHLVVTPKRVPHASFEERLAQIYNPKHRDDGSTLERLVPAREPGEDG